LRHLASIPNRPAGYAHGATLSALPGTSRTENSRLPWPEDSGSGQPWRPVRRCGGKELRHLLKLMRSMATSHNDVVALIWTWKSHSDVPIFQGLLAEQRWTWRFGR